MSFGRSHGPLRARCDDGRITVRDVLTVLAGPLIVAVVPKLIDVVAEELRERRKARAPKDGAA